MIGIAIGACRKAEETPKAPPAPTAQLLQNLDDNADCAIHADELRASDAVSGLVASDIYADGEPLLSFSFPVELVPAIFEP
ncbi:MAG: hypothetical protein SFX73_05215 [Kofleriaceae bacterium]|nr:hypothetical protein [Kofleriaceae bacterium]